MSVYDLSEDRVGKFDVTLALGLIHHCKHVILALEKLFQVTGDLLVLESEVLFPATSFDSYKPALGIGRRLHALQAYVDNDPSLREAVYNWFIPSVDSLKAMLANVGFVDVEVVTKAGRARLSLPGIPSSRPTASTCHSCWPLN